MVAVVRAVELAGPLRVLVRVGHRAQERPHGHDRVCGESQRRRLGHHHLVAPIGTVAVLGAKWRAFLQAAFGAVGAAAEPASTKLGARALLALLEEPRAGRSLKVLRRRLPVEP